jgi:hypothetical protein
MPWVIEIEVAQGVFWQLPVKHQTHRSARQAARLSGCGDYYQRIRRVPDSDCDNGSKHE